jgi:hypothetical protein
MENTCWLRSCPRFGMRPNKISPQQGLFKLQVPQEVKLQYEVGLCIRTSDIVWIHDPFLAGSYSGETIFRHAMKKFWSHLSGWKPIVAMTLKLLSAWRPLGPRAFQDVRHHTSLSWDGQQYKVGSRSTGAYTCISGTPWGSIQPASKLWLSLYSLIFRMVNVSSSLL